MADFLILEDDKKSDSGNNVENNDNSKWVTLMDTINDFLM